MKPQKTVNGLTKKQLQTLLDNDMLHLVLKHNPTAPSAQPMHGAGGIFSEPAVRPDMYSAIPRARTFLSALPLVQSEYDNELISILTAQTGTVGSNPTGTCGDPVTPGVLAKATITRRFGKMFIGSDRVDTTEIGKLNNRADVERVILNGITANPLVPEPLRQPNVNFRSEAAHQLFRAGIAVERAIASVEVDGNSTLTAGSASAGWVREMDGLSRIITSGIRDLSSNTLAPAADSFVVNWGSNTLGATVNGRRFAYMLHEVVFSRQQLANKTGIPVSNWALVMDERLFFMAAYELAAYYATVNLTGATDAFPVNRTAEAIEQRYSGMLDGQYLQLANLRLPVLFTSGDETTVNASSGALTSPMYFVALEEAGTPITYLEYFPMDNRFIAEFNALANTTGRVVINNGLYMMAVRSTGFCDQIMLAAHFRLMCRAPFLCARIDNIVYSPYLGFRSPFPGVTGYEGGGVTTYGL